MKRTALAVSFLLAFAGLAQAANLSVVITVTSPPATGVLFTPAAPFSGSGTAFSAVGPVAAGVTVGTISVTPNTWNGAVSLSGPQAALFTLSGLNLVTAGTLNAGTSDTITLTTVP